MTNSYMDHLTPRLGLLSVPSLRLDDCRTEVQFLAGTYEGIFFFLCFADRASQYIYLSN